MEDLNTNNPDGDELSGGLPVVAGTSRGTRGNPPPPRVVISAPSPAAREPEQELDSVIPFDWPEDKPHPLLIPDVMKEVVVHLEVHDLESARNVSRVWNEETCTILQQHKIVALYDLESVKYYMEKMGDTTWFPHRCFELHLEEVTEETVMLPFWNTFGSHIRYLDLGQMALSIETLLNIITQYLPNLEKLCIKSLPRREANMTFVFNVDDDQNVHPVLIRPFANLLNRAMPMPIRMRRVERREQRWIRNRVPIQMEMEIGNDTDEDDDDDEEDDLPIPPPPPPEHVLENDVLFPQIKEVTIWSCSDSDDHRSLHVLLDIFRRTPSLEKLSTLEIGNTDRLAKLLMRMMVHATINLPQLNSINFPLEVENNDLIVLTQKGYQFPTLTLKLGTSCKSSALKDLLTNMSAGLTKLNVSFHANFFNGGIMFPAYNQMHHPEDTMHLKNVEELTLNKYEGGVGHFQNLLNLKTLNLNGEKITPSIRSLSLDDHGLRELSTNCNLCPPTILSMSLIYPLLHVIKLTGLTDQAMGSIYRNLPYVNEFEIINGAVTDEGLTGVPNEVCRDMAETATFHTVDPSKFRSDLFLGSLQYLKKLKFSGDKVTDMAIVFGIVDCKNLESLTLHSPAFTDEGLYKIADRMSGSLKFLDVHACENVSESGKYYLKEKMKNDSEIILDAATLKQRADTASAATKINIWRQVGFPFRTRQRGTGRPERTGTADDFFIDWERRLFHSDQRHRLVTHLRGQPGPGFDLQEYMRRRLEERVEEQEVEMQRIHEMFETLRSRGVGVNVAPGPNLEDWERRIQAFLDAAEIMEEDEEDEQVPHAPPPPADEGEEARGDDDDEEEEEDM